jgi:hypothetical protein
MLQISLRLWWYDFKLNYLRCVHSVSDDRIMTTVVWTRGFPDLNPCEFYLLDMLMDKRHCNNPRTEYEMKKKQKVAFSASTAEIRRAKNKEKLYGVRNPPPPPKKDHRVNERCVCQTRVCKQKQKNFGHFF